MKPKPHLIVAVTLPIDGTRYIIPERPCDKAAILEEFGEGVFIEYETIVEWDDEILMEGEREVPLHGLRYTLGNLDMLRDYFHVEFR